MDQPLGHSEQLPDATPGALPTFCCPRVRTGPPASTEGSDPTCATPQPGASRSSASVISRQVSPTPQESAEVGVDVPASVSTSRSSSAAGGRTLRACSAVPLPAERFGDEVVHHLGGAAADAQD